MSQALPHEASGPQLPRERMLSLDAFRGFVIGAMLLVNMTWNESVFPRQFFHVPWNDPQQGATFADLVFPWFLFIAGAAIPFSLRSRQGLSTWRILAAAARRAMLLYLLGVLLTVAGTATTHPLSWGSLLQWNILQLIGAAYFVAVWVWLLPLSGRVAFVMLVLVVRWGTMLLPLWDTASGLIESRAPAGAPLGPGTWTHFDALRRIYALEHLPPSAWRSLLGWFGASQEYLPGAVIAVLGGMASSILAANRSESGALRVACGGGVLLLLACFLQWNYQPAGGGLLGLTTIPFSKWFFSPAYCLLAAGTGMVGLAAFFFVIDLKQWTTAWWLRVWGMNALALYVAAELSFKMILSRWLIRLPDGKPDSLASGFLAWVEYATGSPALAAWSFVLGWLGLWWLVCYWLYRKEIFLRV